jgi:Flp pilus assembly protein TadG
MSLNIQHRIDAKSMASRLRHKLTRFGRRRDRGGMAVMCAVMTPVLVGFGTLAINQGYCAYRTQLLRQTTQSAALAAADQLKTFYATGSSTTVVNTAQSFAGYNMPSGQYGTVVPTANVVLGSWNATSNTFTSGGSTPNAVQVTGINTAANGNAVSLFFGAVFGRPSLDLSSTAVASDVSSGSGVAAGGQGTGAAGMAFNTIVVNDMSESFQGQLSDQKTADNLILNCVKGQTGTSSQFGLTLFNGHATLLQALSPANTNATLLANVVSALNALSCNLLLNLCRTGSNVASGLYSAIQQFSGSAYKNQSKNIVIITDGVPNASGLYTAADGVPCLLCSDSDLLTAAQTQAAAAKAAGISISTVYYSGNDTNPSDQATAKTFLAGLVTGSGVALVSPTAAQLDSAYSGVCSTIPSSVKTSS